LRVRCTAPRVRRDPGAFPTRRSADLRAAGRRRRGRDLRTQATADRTAETGDVADPAGAAWAVVPADGGRRGSRGRRADGEGELRSEEHTSELQSREKLVCRLLLEIKH